MSLNTRGTIQAGERAVLYEVVYSAGVDPDLLYEEVNSEIGRVWFDEDDAVSRVELDEWVVEEYGE